jgi:hypothetical protein
MNIKTPTHARGDTWEPSKDCVYGNAGDESREDKSVRNTAVANIEVSDDDAERYKQRHVNKGYGHFISRLSQLLALQVD